MKVPTLPLPSRLLPLTLAAAAAASSAHAALLVEQWQGGGTTGLAGADAMIASRPADVSGIWEIIDFTDDPGGFAGLIPGSNPWPLATLREQSGTSATANNNFVARISGTLNVTIADTYTFRTFNDDGVRLRVGSTAVITDNSYHPEQQYTGSIFLNPGPHLIDLIFFENNGEASLEFSMAQGNNPFGHVGALPGIETLAPAVPEASTWAAGLALAGVGVATWRQARQTRRG